MRRIALANLETVRNQNNIIVVIQINKKIKETLLEYLNKLPKVKNKENNT